MTNKKKKREKNPSQHESLICGLGFTSILNLKMQKQQQSVYLVYFLAKGASAAGNPSQHVSFLRKR